MKQKETKTNGIGHKEIIVIHMFWVFYSEKTKSSHKVSILAMT